MILFCPECQSSLQQLSNVNAVVCSNCGKSFIIKIEFVEIDGNFRQLRGSESTNKDSVGEPDKSGGFNGPERSG
jgi:DNA-directed RNA polymerase subunit M/transcription elongation factor TFIIS